MRHPLFVCALALALVAGRARAEDKPKPKEKAKATTLDTTVTTLAAMSGAYLYEAHQKIGVLGDAQAKEVYKAEVAERELTDTVNLLKTVKKQLADLEKTDIKDDAKKHMKKMGEVIDLEVKSAEGLKAYWKSKGADDAKTYKQNRDAALDKLQDLLGLKKKAKDKEKKG
jgi:hypothetical protein